MRVLAILLVSVYLFSSEVESSGGKVHVKVFYESQCPFCQHFFKKYLTPITEQLGDYMETYLNSYGNSLISDGKLECQHGPRECEYDLIQACAVDRMKGKSSTDRVMMASCFMKGAFKPTRTTGPLCSKQFGLDWDDVLKCSEGPEGMKLMKKNKEEMPHPFRGTPTVYVEGKNTNPWSLKNAVCTKLAEDNIKPAACK
ncbi:hypothetical protein GE061_014695 [Apolygus lucorum]|uniref:Uncharacterized protein n=1 Tax=Apolygus lucorum TaxID=248454 RepID=A0A6A4JL37_APOLU|nr:hypothetical protein GE061_014695 [Apolygus lucorum]